MQDEKYLYVKIIGEKWGFKSLQNSLIMTKDEVTGIWWVYFDRVTPKGVIIPMKAPTSSIAYVEVANATEKTSESESEA